MAGEMLALGAVNLGLNYIQGKRQATRARRAARDQVRASNAEILRQIQDIGAGAARETSGVRLLQGAQGLTGGATASSSLIDMRRQDLLDQQLLARGLTTQTLQAGGKRNTARAGNLFLSGRDQLQGANPTSLLQGLGLSGISGVFGAAQPQTEQASPQNKMRSLF